MISITSEPIDLCNILAEAKDRSAGGTALFIGSVRDHNERETIYEIYYEAYKEMAEQNLTEIENEVRKKWNIKRFVAVHRTGNLKVGDISIAVAVSAEHRKEAFEACKYGVDVIKHEVPIWKKEISGSGGKWVVGIPLKTD
ncbi:MAG: molybdenum cofactor biosynthesis protein MoaE [Nitrososphaeraceae archaeon]|nr:molybdenum cofactor biosynthesis protein MoaE [Nitrososphaeraceae archaeon]